MENKEKFINVIKALIIHNLRVCSKDCPYFGNDQCMDKLIHDIFELIEQYKV